MVFHPTDFYTASGANQVFNYWQPTVEKFNSNSFYNWEQDNLPIYDLEEQTSELWERLGYSTSCVNGTVLTVSSTAGADDLGKNSNYFLTIQDAVDAIPDIVRSSFIIEVASWGALGDVEIHGRSFEGSGSIEIRNLLMDEIYTSLGGNKWWEMYLSVDAANPQLEYDPIGAVSSHTFGTYYTWSNNATYGAKTIAGELLFSSVALDARLSGAGISHSVLGSPPYVEGTTDRKRQLTSVCVSSNNLLGPTPAAYLYYPQPYEINSQTEEAIDTYDCSTTNRITSTELYRSGQANTNAVRGCMYLNEVGKISIKGCDGPVYVRGLFANAQGFGGGARAVEVIDSNKVLLENIAGVRASEAGFYIENSHVVFTRLTCAYRNYGFNSDGNRLTELWENVNALAEVPPHDPAAGLKAINSHITFSSTSDYIKSVYDLQLPAAGDVFPYDELYLSFTRNSNGIVLENSILDGGQITSDISGTPTAPFVQTVLDVEKNVNYGLVSRDSQINLKGRLNIYGNTRGALIENSTIRTTELDVENNQREGLKLVNSLYEYNSFLPSGGANLNTSYNLGTHDYNEMSFSGNGQHLVAENSIMRPAGASSILTRFGKMRFQGAHGLTNDPSFTLNNPVLPSIEAKSGSEVVLISPYMIREAANTMAYPSYGSCVKASDNSKVKIQGSASGASVILGPNTFSTQEKSSGVYAKDNSKIEFNGPTVIAQFAVDALAEDNSVIEFGPHKTNEGALDSNTFDLENPANHTHVELHSTRACLVANRGSQINLKDLGDYNYTWGIGAQGTLALASGVDYNTATENDTSALTYAGSMQFYPNPNDEADIENASPSVSWGGPENRIYFEPTTQSGKTQYYYMSEDPFIAANFADLSGITGGGVCVRAVDNSNVKVKNVHFPTGWWNPSGTTFNSSGFNAVDDALCDKLFIWNIADKSQLSMSQTSLSGVYPQDAGYFGPSSVYDIGGGVAYLAPSSTPDTSSLSVLDSFGQTAGSVLPTPAGGMTSFGFTTPENQGAFRIYMSPDPYVRHFDPSGSVPDQFSEVYQLFAQGYAPANDLSATAEVSSVYGAAMHFNSAGTALEADGFIYVSAVMSDTSKNIIIDESGANTFANAKHAASGKSARPKMLTIYSSHVSKGGEGVSNNVVGFLGNGFKSAIVFDLDRDN